MTDNEIFEFKEMLFKKFNNEDVRFIEYKLLEVLKKRENGCVKVIVKKIDKDIEVIIEDDGVGIEQTVIDNLDKQIQENIGLKNVHQRLKLLYGEGLNIKKLEQGTRINFRILGGVKYD